MSSTNRGAVRSEHDYYVTPQADIVHFLKEWMRTDAEASVALTWETAVILDPCAGGNSDRVLWHFKEGKFQDLSSGTEEIYEGFEKRGVDDKVIKAPVIFDLPPTPMSYPSAIRTALGVDAGRAKIVTMDIRENSPAEFHRDYLNDPCPTDGPPDIIISNPPFNLALDFIRHSLAMVKDGGFVVMLLRLNFFGSASRNAFFKEYMPRAAYVHHARMGFTPDGKTDSIEYMHAVWRKGPNRSRICNLRVI